MKFTGLSGFFAGLGFIIAAAIIYPELGATGGPLYSQVLTKVGVFVIFYLQGVLLPVSEIRKGLLQWKVNLTVLLIIFVAAPIIAWLLLQPVRSFLTPDIYLGSLFLGFLPTTLSTAVVFTTLAGGSIVVALFSTAFSNIIGIFIVPTLATILLASTQDTTVPITPMLLSISKILLLPLILGQLSRHFISEIIQQHRKLVGRINSWIILFTLYVAFCNSIAGGTWAKHGWKIGLEALGVAVILHLVLLAFTYLVFFKLMKASQETAIAGFFCASQKTIAAGVPLATTIFVGLPAGSGMPELGLFILPLMMFHPFQLFVGAFFIERFKKLPSS